MAEETFFADIPMFNSFPFLFQPRPSDTKKPDGTPDYVTYETTGCIVADHPIWLEWEARVRACALRVLREKFGPTAQFGVGGFHSPFRPDTDFDLAKYPNYAGKIMLPMRSRSGNGRTGEVDLVDVSGYKLTDPKSLYPGCIIVPSFGFYAYNNEKRKGVSGALRCVRKIADSTPWVTIASAERDYKGFDPSKYKEIDNSAMYAGSGSALDDA